MGLKIRTVTGAEFEVLGAVEYNNGMKGAFKNHIDLYDTLNGMTTMSGETVGQTLIKVLDTVEQMTA